MNNKIRLDVRTRGFFKTFKQWPVSDSWAGELYNFFILGYQPGSFHTAVLANDLKGAVYKSHISNQWEDIQSFVRWMFANAPAKSIGSYENVQNWLALTDDERTKIGIERKWILTDEELTWKLLEEV